LKIDRGLTGFAVRANRILFRGLSSSFVFFVVAKPSMQKTRNINKIPDLQFRALSSLFVFFRGGEAESTKDPKPLQIKQLPASQKAS